MPLKHLYKGSFYQMRNRCTIITRIRTSDGLIGEAYNADSDEEQAEILGIINDEIAPMLIGKDVLAVERSWNLMVGVALDRLRDRRLPMQAIACVDSAIWDAVGIYAGMPLWQLWGGFRDRIPMIGIGGYYGSSEADLEKELGFFKGEHGMVGMKFKIGAQSPEKDAQRLRVAKSIVGDDFIFVVDANQGYSVAEALSFLSLIEDDVTLRWFEEPTRWHADWRGLRDLPRSSRCSSATTRKPRLPHTCSPLCPTAPLSNPFHRRAILSTGICSRTGLRLWTANFHSRPAQGSGGSWMRTSSRSTEQTSRQLFLGF